MAFIVGTILLIFVFSGLFSTIKSLLVNEYYHSELNYGMDTNRILIKEGHFHINIYNDD